MARVYRVLSGYIEVNGERVAKILNEYQEHEIKCDLDWFNNPECDCEDDGEEE